MRGPLPALKAGIFGTGFAVDGVMRRFLLIVTLGGLPLWMVASPDTTEAVVRPPFITLDSALSRPLMPLRALPHPGMGPGEVLQYEVRYGFITAGEARLVTQPGPRYGGRPTWQVVGTGRSTGAFDWVFKVRDHYESHVDREGLFPHRFIRRVREGGYRLDREIAFDAERRTATTFEKGTLRHQVLPDYCQDLVSAFHYARQLPIDSLSVGAVIGMATFLDGEVHTVKARKVGRETIKVKAGTFDCWVFQPLVMAGRIWEDGDDLTVYISADDTRMPVLVKSDLLVGSIRLELISFEGASTAGAPQ